MQCQLILTDVWYEKAVSVFGCFNIVQLGNTVEDLYLLFKMVGLARLLGFCFGLFFVFFYFNSLQTVLLTISF